ncbi:MAG: efflux RND transporter permease subunit, partial [Myxococcales bacterium]
MAHRTDEELIEKSHNTARYFTDNRHVAWVLLVATLIAGTFGYLQMPKRKDPLIPVRVAVAITPWPGAPAEKVEQLVTRKIEEKIAANSEVEKIESTSRNGVSVVQVTVRADAKNLGRALDDIDSRIKNIRDLPEGALPIDFKKDFGDTAALMLTVASPRISDAEIAIRAQAIEASVRAARSAARQGARHTIVFNFPGALNPLPIARIVDQLAAFARAEGADDVRPVRGSGFVGFDALVDFDRESWHALVQRFENERLQGGWLHPDLWDPAIIEQPEQASEELQRVAGSRYSLRQLDDFSDQIAKRIQV